MHGIDPYLAERSMDYDVREIHHETEEDRLAGLAASQRVGWVSQQSHMLLRRAGRRLSGLGSWLEQLGTLPEVPLHAAAYEKMVPRAQLSRNTRGR